MSVFGQIDGATDVITTAASHGWEAALLAFITLSGLAFLTYWLRQDSSRTKEREERMAKRIDCLEDQLNAIQSAYSERLVEVTRSVTQALAKATDAQLELAGVISSLRDTTARHNEDIRELCQLLKFCPCLLTGVRNGEYEIVDKSGNRVRIHDLLVEAKKERE